jgi:hypothetical protein
MLQGSIRIIYFTDFPESNFNMPLTMTRPKRTKMATEINPISFIKFLE